MHTQGKQKIKTRLFSDSRKLEFATNVFILNDFRFGEKMSNVKKDNDRRTARLQIDRNSASNGLVTTNKFVSSRNKIIASAASANHHRQQQSNPESLHRYNHSSHGSTNQNPHNRPPPPHHGLLSGSHPMLDRSKHKKQNPEIMKRTLRYLPKRIFVIQFVITHCQCLLITENVLFISWLLDP